MPAPYFCAVEGQRSPKKVHLTLESAKAEAVRLHTLYRGLKTVWILVPAETLPPSAKAIASAERFQRKVLGLPKKPQELVDT